MNRAEIADKIVELEKTSGTNTGWHQRINIGGVWTTTKHVTDVELVERIVSNLITESLIDKEVLDIGTNAGLFCLQLSQYGARCHGVESKNEWYKQALFVRDQLGGKYSLIAGFVDDFNLSQAKYDYVFAISVLRYIGVNRFGFKLTNKLSHYQVEFIKILANKTNNFIIKCGLTKYDNIDFWSGVLASCGFVENGSIIAYPDVPNAKQSREIKRFTRYGSAL